MTVTVRMLTDGHYCKKIQMKQTLKSRIIFFPSFYFVSFYDEAFERLLFFLSRNTCKMGLMLTLILLLIR